MFSHFDPGTGRPMNFYLRGQTILVGAHKLLHDAPKMPLFVVVPDPICDAYSMDRPLRIVPFGLRNLILHDFPSAQNNVDAGDTEMGDTPASSFVSPAPQSTSTSLSPSNGLSLVPSFKEDARSDEISSLPFTACTTKLDNGNSSAHEMNSGSIPKSEAEIKDLVVMSMDINDPWGGDQELKVVLPRDRSSRGPFSAPFESMQKPEQIVIAMNCINATTQATLVVDVQEPDVRLPSRMPGNLREAIMHKSPPPIMSDNSKEFSQVTRGLVTHDSLPGNARRATVHTSPISLASPRWRRVFLEGEKVKFADRGANISSQNMATSPPPRYSLLQDESISLSISHPLRVYQSHELLSNHKTSELQALPFPYIPSQEAEMFSIDLSPSHSQAATLLAMLNASSIPHIKPYVPEPASGVSCLHDSPIVKLAPIGSPTARPTRSSYAWGRAESSCGSTPATSPLLSPYHSAQQQNEVPLPWPPVLTGSSFGF